MRTFWIDWISSNHGYLKSEITTVFPTCYIYIYMAVFFFGGRFHGPGFMAGFMVQGKQHCFRTWFHARFHSGFMAPVSWLTS